MTVAVGTAQARLCPPYILLIFGDLPDGAMIFGASIIVASGLYTFHREHIRNREMLTTAKASGVPTEAS